MGRLIVENHYLLTILISILSIIISIISLLMTIRHNLLVRRYAAAAPEANILSQINQSRARLSDISIKMNDISKGRLPRDLSADEKRQMQSIEMAYRESVEALLNVYELACGMYLDGKLDKERFKRQYSEELRRLFSNDLHAYKNLHGIASPFKEMQKVYREWND